MMAIIGTLIGTNSDDIEALGGTAEQVLVVGL